MSSKAPNILTTSILGLFMFGGIWFVLDKIDTAMKRKGA